METTLVNTLNDCPLSPRIAISYIEGRGDNGTTQVTINDRIDKADLSVDVYLRCEDLRHSIGLALLNNDVILDNDIHELLVWLRSACFSISSFCYCKGVSRRHNFPESLLSYLEQAIAEFKGQVGNAQDFIIWERPIGIYLDNIRVKVRLLERSLTAWSKEVPCDTATEDVKYLRACINRLSTYIFWATRHTYKNNQLTEVYWEGRMPSLTFLNN
jgi:cob(I)alamin adenosyltransferase